jgi:hypothetical protein
MAIENVCYIDEFTHKQYDKEEMRASMIIGIYLIFMVCNKIVRTCTRILKMLLKKGKKNKIKRQKKELLLQQAEQSTPSTTDEDKVIE